MEDINVILGENGTGKTRYLLKYFEEHYQSEHVAVVSNSLINPFPYAYRRRHHNYGLRTRNYSSRDYFGLSINGYIDGLINENSTEMLFTVLNNVGFDEEFTIDSRPFYKIESYLDERSKTIKYKLMANEFGKETQFKRIGGFGMDGCFLTQGFVEKYGKYFDENNIFHINRDNYHVSNNAFSNQKLIEKEINEIIGKSPFHTKLFNREFYVSKEGVRFPISNASSGELYVFSLGLFVRDFLVSNFNSTKPKTILIDEPENSLHPRWQKEYISYLVGFIGYENVKVIMATHSPFIAMETSRTHIKVFEMINGLPSQMKYDSENKNIEQVYYQLFGVLTPKNRFLSDYCNNLLKGFAEGRIDFYEVHALLVNMKKASFDEMQCNFIDDVIDLLNKLNEKQ